LSHTAGASHMSARHAGLTDLTAAILSSGIVQNYPVDEGGGIRFDAGAAKLNFPTTCRQHRAKCGRILAVTCIKSAAGRRASHHPGASQERESIAYVVSGGSRNGSRQLIVMMHRAEYVKPDGRRLWLYGRCPRKSPRCPALLQQPPRGMPIFAAIPSGRNGSYTQRTGKIEPFCHQRKTTRSPAQLIRGARPSCRPAITRWRYSKTGLPACRCFPVRHRPSRVSKPPPLSEAAKSSSSRRIPR
jgi:hypothetical protein